MIVWSRETLSVQQNRCLIMDGPRRRASFDKGKQAKHALKGTNSSLCLLLRNSFGSLDLMSLKFCAQLLY